MSKTLGEDMDAKQLNDLHEAMAREAAARKELKKNWSWWRKLLDFLNPFSFFDDLNELIVPLAVEVNKPALAKLAHRERLETNERKFAVMQSDAKVTDLETAIAAEAATRKRAESSPQTAGDAESKKFEDAFSALSQKERYYDQLIARKKAAVAKYGSEAQFPEFLKAEFDDIEDKLGFRK